MWNAGLPGVGGVVGVVGGGVSVEEWGFQQDDDLQEN